jgi:hypothetical protein
VAPPEKQLDRLYTLPLGEFTAARNALAKELKRAGDAEGAAVVQALAKPTAAVWAVNQAARGDRPAVRALLKAADALRAAQARTLGSRGGSAALRRAQQAERDAVERLAERARSALEADGASASRATLDRVERTIAAAALAPDARELLRAGRLTHELEPGGFELLGGLAPVNVKDELEERRRANAEARRRKAELQKAARDAERRALQAEAAADEARREAEDARAEADRAAAALAEL